MSTNKLPPDSHRLGAVKDRSQLETNIEGGEHWTKRDPERSTGPFCECRLADL